MSIRYFSLSQQFTQPTDVQEEEIRMSINLPYVEGTSEKIVHILRSQKIRPNFYTESTSRELAFKPKDPIPTKGKLNIVYETDFNNCEVVYLSESKRSLTLRSNKHKRSVRNCYCENNEIVRYWWETRHNFSLD